MKDFILALLIPLQLIGMIVGFLGMIVAQGFVKGYELAGELFE